MCHGDSARPFSCTNVQNFGAQKKEIKTLYNCASFEIREKLKPLNELAKTFKVLEMRTYLGAALGKRCSVPAVGRPCPTCPDKAGHDWTGSRQTFRFRFLAITGVQANPRIQWI